MAMMSDSVVAKLLPTSTMVEPRRSKFSCGIFVILANFAMSVAACSAVILVASAMFAMVLVNSTIFSFLIPSCPALSAISASPVTLMGISSLDIRLNSLPMVSSSLVLMSVVFATPIIALS